MSQSSVSPCGSCGLHNACFPVVAARGDRRLLERLRIRQEHLDRGASLYRAGDRLDALYVVRGGCVKDVVTLRSGGESILHFCLPGEVAGLAGLGEERCVTTAIALETSHCCRIPWSCLQRVARESPDVGRELVRVLSGALASTQELVVAIGERTALGRVSGFLVDLAARLRHRHVDAGSFRLRMGRRDIAAYLGLTLETVSRSFSELDRRDVVRVRGKQVDMLRPAELRRLAAN